MSNRDKTVSINDVALAAGVSIATVSRFLNGQLNRMSDKTAKKIQTIIDEMGYVPNAAARQLMTKSSKMIAVVVANIDDHFSSELFKGIGAISITEGYTPVLFDSNDDKQQELDLINKIDQQNFDAIIIQPLNTDAQVIQKQIKRKVPILTVDRSLENAIWPKVISDNYEIAKKVSEYYLKKDYQQVIVITEPIGTVSTRQARTKGIQEIYPDATIMEVNIQETVGNKLIDNVINNIDKKERTLIFALKERLVLRLASLLIRQDVNKNLMLTGFAEADMIFEINPELQLVRQNPFKMGATAGELMLELLKNKSNRVAETTTIKAKFI
ncbi:LacI family DNA-binding transcriptional regulator [Weissella paramesenteroides]|uniref:LacI family DNA-binding transcriptional regulator n=1 Tax=Weissella paramesenteroides TaxID=1249 RepID=UPI00123C5D97|nr:LacI family DNA-binding transcriptional regulator [Weissella paramesenteroides]KAA8456467.1 LacI family transcriptional regulator [Weissella paramesenteroides]KAA8456589.1 LacI family transcriptional regulator [Weissella paramesenteroides]KAA8459089.1 LacI family transcriptional regulator [Weissella paramesenteroides]KAA8463495.1 LacI family transcriptional regulator [Weissella paramesenteroides]KAA8465546.1 LacI family transcriptional regulator [Weissella paramesenteroides]